MQSDQYGNKLRAWEKHPNLDALKARLAGKKQEEADLAAFQAELEQETAAEREWQEMQISAGVPEGERTSLYKHEKSPDRARG